MAALGLTIPGANGGSPLIFGVKGQSLGNEVTAFSNSVATATVIIGTETAPAAPKLAGLVTVTEVFTGPTSTGHYTIATPDGYTAMLTSQPTTVTGSTAGGDTVVATDNVTYNAVGGNNNIAFMYGENVYNGGSVSGDTVTGSEGSDTINTGTGNTTVFSGYGTTNITLNDTASGGDIAYLGDGHAFVTADGLSDTVWAAVSGQQIFGGVSTAPSTLFVNITSKTGNMAFVGNDLVVAGSAQTLVADSIGGNTIFGGTAGLVFIGGEKPGVVQDRIFAGSGGATIYGNVANDLTVGGAAGGNAVIVTAGLGNETLNGAFAAGGVNFFLKNTSADTSPSVANDPINDTVTGGTGANYFSTGSGNETLNAGSGTNWFDIQLGGAGTNITINDFAANSANIVNLLNESSGAIQTAELTQHLVNGNLTLTLSDSTTVTFVGLNNIDQLTNHII